MGNLTGRFCVNVLATHATRVIFIFGNLLVLLSNRSTTGRRQPMETPSSSEVWDEVISGRGTKLVPMTEMTLVFHEILQTPLNFPHVIVEDLLFNPDLPHIEMGKLISPNLGIPNVSRLGRTQSIKQSFQSTQVQVLNNHRIRDPPLRILYTFQGALRILQSQSITKNPR
jgi:hypothetical protein